MNAEILKTDKKYTYQRLDVPESTSDFEIILKDGQAVKMLRNERTSLSGKTTTITWDALLTDSQERVMRNGGSTSENRCTTLSVEDDGILVITNSPKASGGTCRSRVIIANPDKYIQSLNFNGQ